MQKKLSTEFRKMETSFLQTEGNNGGSQILATRWEGSPCFKLNFLNTEKRLVNYWVLSIEKMPS